MTLQTIVYVCLYANGETTGLDMGFFAGCQQHPGKKALEWRW